MIFFTCWSIGLLLVAIDFFFHGKFLARLKSGYPRIYRELGEPKIFTKYPISSKLIISDLSPNKSLTKYTDFMSSKKWKDLHDVDLNRFARYKRFTQYALAALFIVAFMSVEPRP